MAVFPALIIGGTAAGIPYWVFGSFWLGAICSVGAILISVLSPPENPPSPEELAELRAEPTGLGPFVHDIADAVRDMPASLHELGLGHLFQWFAIVIHWQYVPVVVVHTVFNSDESNNPVHSQAVSMGRAAQRLRQHRHVLLGVSPRDAGAEVRGEVGARGLPDAGHGLHGDHQDSDPDTDLIVVGNRGLGSATGSFLGCVPGDVARRATCDVLIAQTAYQTVDEEDDPA